MGKGSAIAQRQTITPSLKTLSPNGARLYEEAWDTAFLKLSTVASASGLLKLKGCTFANIRGVVLPREWLIRALDEPEAFQISDLVSGSYTLDDQRHLHWNGEQAGHLLQRNLALRHALHWEPRPALPER